MPRDKWGVRQMTDDELIEWTGGWKPSCAAHLAGIQELKRRNEIPNSRRSWIAMGISLGSLSVALAALLIALT